MEYNGTAFNQEERIMWNYGNAESYTVIDGTNTYSPSAYSYQYNYVQEEQYVQEEFYEQLPEQQNTQEYVQDDFWKKYFNGDWENKDDRLIEILKMLLVEQENKLFEMDESGIQEKISLIKEALEIAGKTHDFHFKPIKPKEQKPSYLDDDLFEI